MGTDRAAVMVVRIWVEGPDNSLRARLTQTLDLGTREQTSHVAATVEEVLALVRDWIGAFLSDTAGGVP
jgi:hypothetical protein